MRDKLVFAVGDMVRIRTGAFQAFTARIEEVDERREVLKVLIVIFGRKEPIELRFVDVQKISFTEEE